MRTVLVTGANGQLGSRLMENPGQYPLRIVGFDRDELDITSPDSIANRSRNTSRMSSSTLRRIRPLTERRRNRNWPMPSMLGGRDCWLKPVVRMESM
jgi:hypothetical protein